MVLDVGCGCGVLTGELATIAGRAIAIDISGKSVATARSVCAAIPNVEFITVSVQEYSRRTGHPSFTLAVANMSLMTTIDLNSAVDAIARLLKPHGHLVFTITHPCFWPLYWQYSREWFSYKQDIVIEAPFKISLDQHRGIYYNPRP